jgi:hypothetical protein
MLRISQPRIISFVRLLGKPRIFRPLLEYYTLKWINLSPTPPGIKTARFIPSHQAAMDLTAAKGVPAKIPYINEILQLQMKPHFPHKF